MRPRPRATGAQVKAWALAAVKGDQQAALRLVGEVLTAWVYEDELVEGGDWEDMGAIAPEESGR